VTWERQRAAGAPVANLPTSEATWAGIARLAEVILDPLRERFGAIVVTYGFAGPALTRRVAGGIAPRLDQHAGSEVGARGAAVCARGGQACDLRVPGVSAFEVARWVGESLPFDRMYLYGAARSVHVSHGPDGARSVHAMVRRASRVVPYGVGGDEWGRLEALLGDG